MKYSVIIPVYNRPEELKELLLSLETQTFTDFEVIVVEDGSVKSSKTIAEFFSVSLPLKYYEKPNEGPGPSRNYGVARAEGEYVIILDSDVVLPPNYLHAIDDELKECPEDIASFGGPDRSSRDFTPIQRAVSYAMTSFFTTGGIRGNSAAKLDKFFPRSFNMGVKRSVYNELNGFAKMRFGEDMDFSYRIIEAGYKSRLFPSAWVYHKRRANFRQFFKQVHNSGIARINLQYRHPDTLKPVHAMPAAFTVGVLLLLVVGFFWPWAWLPLGIYALLIFLDALLVKREHPKVCGLAIVASFVQLFGYGSGFIRCWWQRKVLGHGEIEAFKNNFYK